MRFPYVVLLSACALMLVLPLLAQSPNGVINGLVADPSNHVIVASDVVVVNDVTGVKYTTKTNAEGIYVLPNLPPGPYRLQVSKLGFKTIIKPDIILNIQDALSINFTLPVGASYETVTVEGGASMINTTDASVSTVIDNTYVENMPLNGRSFQDLILLTPGVVTQTPQGNSSVGRGNGQTGEFSVDGQRTESNDYTVDGVSANVGAVAGTTMLTAGGASGSVPGATALGTTQALVSVDDLQEFRVQSSSYSAEYGRNPGGQFAFETKSGTNHWHGTAYDYLRNGFFDAQDWFNDYFGTPESALRQNDFGGTIGGPVEIPGLYHGKDKTFFFVSYEGLRLAAPQAAMVNYVPDLCLRGMTESCTGQNTPAPAALQPVLNAFPVPSPNGIDDAANGIAQYIGSWSNPSSLDSTSVRFDHVVKARLRLFFRFSNTSSSSASRGTSAAASTPTTENTSAYTMRTYTGGASSIFSSRLSNEFRLNYTSNGTTGQQDIDAFGGSTPVNLRQLVGLSAGSAAGVGLFYGAYGFELSQLSQAAAQRQWNVVDAISLSSSGRHQFKFGVDYRRLTPFTTPIPASAAYFYFSESAVVANSPATQAEMFAAAYPSYTNFSAFVQDQWKVSRRLSLSLGLRWDVNPAPSVTQGLKPYTVQGSGPDTWALAPQGTPLWRTTWFNFAPRLGAAYVVRDAPGWETVVRGGGGVFYDTGQQLASGGFVNGPGFSAISFNFVAPQPFPALPAIPSIANPPVAGTYSPFGFAPHLQLPYTLQWNASAEQALGKSQAITVSYVGSHASRLLQENVFEPVSNPNAKMFFFVENGLTSDYDSLQVQFRRKLSGGLTALGSYAWSHCIDYGSENYTFGYQRGDCDFDIRHSFSAAFSYDLPNLTHAGFVNAVLHHWGLDERFMARTAYPITLVGNQLPQPNGQIYDGGLSFVPGQPVYLYGANCASVLQGLGDLLPGKGCPGGQAINPLAFAAVNSGLGDAPRNFARLFGAWQMSLAVRRVFPIHEGLKLQFRAEAFNVFNHPSFGTVNPYFGEPNFGQATGTLANSLGTLNQLYQMGGPRSMQFALRLLF
jgi:hypothetical protein